MDTATASSASSLLLRDLRGLVDLGSSGAMKSDSVESSRSLLMTRYEEWVAGRSLTVPEYRSEWHDLQETRAAGLISMAG